MYNKGLALQQKGDYTASEEAYNHLLNSALVKEVSGRLENNLFLAMLFLIYVLWELLMGSVTADSSWKVKVFMTQCSSSSSSIPFLLQDCFSVNLI